MIDTWKDAFTIVGGFFATALTVVTITKFKSSNEGMRIPESILVQLTELSKDIEHLQADFKGMSKKWEKTHGRVNDIHDAMISWNKLKPNRGAGPDTETGEI